MRANPASVVDPLLDALWDRGLILIGDRVRQEYALNTPIFIDLRHKLYDDGRLFDCVEDPDEEQPLAAEQEPSGLREQLQAALDGMPDEPAHLRTRK